MSTQVRTLSPAFLMFKMISKTKIDKRLRRKNPNLAKTIILLKKQKKPIWLIIAKLLSNPKRKSVAVNISKINKLTKENDIVVVPGKILSDGTLEKPLTIVALSYSEKTKEKLKKAKLITIEKLLKENPKATGVKIII